MGLYRDDAKENGSTMMGYIIVINVFWGGGLESRPWSLGIRVRVQATFDLAVHAFGVWVCIGPLNPKP